MDEKGNMCSFESGSRGWQRSLVGSIEKTRPNNYIRAMFYILWCQNSTNTTTQATADHKGRCEWSGRFECKDPWKVQHERKLFRAFTHAISIPAKVLVGEHGFVTSDRLFNWTLTAQRGYHSRVAHARSTPTLLLKYAQSSIAPKCLFIVSVLQSYRAE